MNTMTFLPLTTLNHEFMNSLLPVLFEVLAVHGLNHGHVRH